MNKGILEEIEVLLFQGYGGRFLVERYTQRIDLLIQNIFTSIAKGADITLIATGGYGRTELAPFSDIDIMFFAPDRTDTGPAEQMLYHLWDTGLMISHSFRTIDECIEEASKDIRTRTSLLEARYIAGSRNLYRVFTEKVYPEIAHKQQKKFIAEKLMEMKKRHVNSGNSVFMLEPDVKEGEGGLRDVHTAFWLSMVAYKIVNMSGFSSLLNSYDYRRFMSAYDFLLKTRFCLHFETKRKIDVLFFDYQKNVSERLGFKDSKKFSASERLMRYYYLKSTVVKDMSRLINDACSRLYLPVRKDMNVKKIKDEFSVSAGKLIITKNNLFEENPDKIMEGFYLYSKTGKKFSGMMREQIKSNLLRINKKTRNSPYSVRYFLEIFKGVLICDTLREMHEIGVLGRFIPEFGALRLLVVHEPYHKYTVDEHTLLAIKNLEELKTTGYMSLEHLKVIINGMKNSDALFMALLFHDIGKAVGRHHEEEGYKRLKNIMERFNLDSKKRMRIEFLVKNHILMSKIALKREISDIEVIARFADEAGDIENLKALYLITYADMSAVNPEFLTSWKTYLLKDLYERTMDYLSGIKENREDYIKSLQELSPELIRQELIEFLDEMPERYRLSTTKSKVLEDFQLVEKMKESGFSMRIDSRSEDVVEIVICAEDRPGLFSQIVGFLSSKGLNIVHGRIFTGKNGIVIDKISISNWKEIWWERLGHDLEEGLKIVIIKGMPVNVVNYSIRAEKDAGLFGVFVELDNEASEEYSIIEIFASDRSGLLYDIANAMYKKGINIDSARISTDAGLVQDVFYIQFKRAKVNNIIAQELLSELWAILKK